MARSAFQPINSDSRILMSNLLIVQLGRAGFPYVMAAIVLHGSGGSSLNLITGR